MNRLTKLLDNPIWGILLGVWMGASMGVTFTYHYLMESGKRAGVVEVVESGFKPGWRYEWVGQKH